MVCGAHAVLYVNGRPYSRVYMISPQVSEPQREIHVVDSLEPVEEVPLGITMRYAMGVYRLHGDGGAEGAGLTGPRADAALQKYSSLLVVDRVNDFVLFRSDRGRATQQGWQVSRGLLVGTLQVNALDLSNEVVSAA